MTSYRLTIRSRSVGVTLDATFRGDRLVSKGDLDRVQKSCFIARNRQGVLTWIAPNLEAAPILFADRAKRRSNEMKASHPAALARCSASAKSIPASAQSSAW